MQENFGYLDEALDLVFVIDFERKIRYVNKSFTQFLQKNQQENFQLGINLFGLPILKTYQNQIEPILENVLQGQKESIVVEWEKNKIYEIRFSPIKDKLILAICRDYPDIQLQQKKTLSLEELLITIFRTIPLGLVVHDKMGRITLCNQKACEILGVSNSDLIGKTSFDPIWNLIHEDGTPFLSEDHPAIIALRTGKEVSNIIMGLRKIDSLESVWLNISAIPFLSPDSDELENVYIAFKDITENYLSEKKMYLAMQETQKAFHNLEQLHGAISQHAIVAITDKKGVIQFVNEKFVEISQYSSRELIGNTHRIINSGHHPKSFFKHMHETILAGNVWRGQIRNRKKNGDHYWVDTTIVPILNEKGEIERFISIRTDITGKMKAVESLGKAVVEQRGQNITKEKLLRIISHDLKNPFGGISNLAELLATNESILNDKEKSKKFLSLISFSAKNVHELLEDLLSWSKYQSHAIVFAPDFYDLDYSLEKIVNLFQGFCFYKNITIETVSNIERKVFFDKQMLETIIRNIINNSVKFTEHGGIIKIISTFENNILKLEIIDNGIGMSQEVQASLFQKKDPITRVGTNNETGTGLGFLLCKEFVDAHSGTISIKSEENKGSTFTIEIPSKIQ